MCRVAVITGDTSVVCELEAVVVVIGQHCDGGLQSLMGSLPTNPNPSISIPKRKLTITHRYRNMWNVINILFVW